VVLADIRDRYGVGDVPAGGPERLVAAEPETVAVR